MTCYIQWTSEVQRVKPYSFGMHTAFQWGYLGTVPNYQTLCVQEMSYCSGDGVATALENLGKFKSENKTGF